MKLTNNDDPDTFRYSGYGNGFDANGQMVTGVKILLFLMLVWAPLCMLIIKIKMC